MQYTSEQRTAIEMISNGYMRWLDDHRDDVFNDMRLLMDEAIQAWGAYKGLREFDNPTTEHRAWFVHLMGCYIARRDQYQGAHNVSA